MASPSITLRVDVSGTAFGGSPTWTDWSTALTTAGDGSPISITRGRQDGQSEPQPATCTFVLDNTTGAYTPGNAAAAAGWDVGARINVRVTVSGTTYDRFDGLVDSIEPAYPGQSWSLVSVTATDITARLAIGQPLKSLVLHEMLADNPTYLYPLSEPSGSTSAGDVTANGNPAAVRFDSKYGPGTVDFGAELPLAEATSGVDFGESTALNAPASALRIASADSSFLLPPALGGFTWEGWFLVDGIPANPGYLCVAAGRAQTAVSAAVLNGTGQFFWGLSDSAGTLLNAISPASVTDSRLHQYAGTFSSDRKTVRLYIDGTQVATSTTGTALDISGLFASMVGGVVNLVGTSGNTFPGTAGLIAQYSGELSAARVLAHYQAGVGALIESTDDRYARLAGYANVTTGTLPAGIAVVGHQDAAGKTITEALQQVARSEGSVSYATGSGALMFQDREARYNVTTGLALTSADINPDATTRRDRQGMANEFTVTRSGGASQRVVDVAAQAAEGRFDGGSLDVVVSTDTDAQYIAQWEVATRKDAKTRLPNLTVDLLTIATTATVQAVLAADLSTLVTVTSLPSQAPASSMSVLLEGWTESIGLTQWTWTAFTSPNLPAVQTVDDGVGGTDPTAVLDGTFLVAL